MEIQKNILLFFSSIHVPILDKIAEFFTLFGESTVPIAIGVCLFWCFDKKKGALSAMMLFVSCNLMSLIKAIVRFPRPWVLLPELETQRIQTATGYSFPSGHSATASSFYSAIAISYKKKKLSIICALMILLVPVSRMYLCVHWPLDVVCGLLLGIFTTVSLYRFVSDLIDNIQTKYKMLMIFGFCFFLVGLVMAILLTYEKIDYLAYSDFSRFIGMTGLCSFFFALEEKYCDFSTDGTALQKILRLIVGMIISLFILEVVKKWIVYNPLTSFFRYSLCISWACLYPMIGKKIGLFN